MTSQMKYSFGLKELSQVLQQDHAYISVNEEQEGAS